MVEVSIKDALELYLRRALQQAPRCKRTGICLFEGPEKEAVCRYCRKPLRGSADKE